MQNGSFASSNTVTRLTVDVRVLETDEDRLDHLKPRVPHALPDGRIPPEATNPFLLVQAPIVDVPGSGSLPGDRFIAIVDGDEISESATEYVDMKDDYVELHIPKKRVDELADGFHALSYRVYPEGFGRQVLSGATLIDLDRTPALGRLLT
ncbi:hypothetical protein [Luteibacter sp.]|uniref:hypothetical protein n=1 Tax=Luteibacter sp. TaxID=1886636 RepID=UPI003F817648